MDAELKATREIIKKSLKTNFEKILLEAKLTEQEEAVVRMRILPKEEPKQEEVKDNAAQG